MKNISAWAIRHPVTPLVLFMVLTFMGIVSFVRLPINLNPDISFPAIEMIISQPGASPVEIEKQIIQKIEGSVAGVGNVHNITSRATEGTAQQGRALEEAQAPPGRTVAAPPENTRRPGEQPDSPPRPRDQEGPPRSAADMLGQQSPEDSGEEEEEVEVPVIASDEESLRGRSFDALAPAELAALYRLMSRLALAPPLRRTRRYVKSHRRGRVDLRRTLRLSLRTGGGESRAGAW